ncbi:MAG: restriction endonuclease subunit S [Egibacteraceae bacterium]
MSDLPSGWVWTTIGEIADTSLGKMLDKKRATGLHPTPYLRNFNVRWGSFDLSDLAEMDIRPEELDRVLAQPGDVIACEGGEPGRAAVWRGPGTIALQKALHRIRLGGAVLPGYLALLLQHLATSRRLDPLLTGTTIKHLPQEKLRRVPVPLPPLAEQERIVAALEKYLSGLEAAERLLSSIAKRLIQFSLGASAAPSSWPRVAIGEVAEVFVGTTPSRAESDLWGGPVAWVSSGEVAFCRIRRTRETIAQNAVRPDRVHPPGTVLLAMIGEGKTRGQAAILNIPAAHNQNSAAIRPKHEIISSEWLYQALKDQYVANRRVGSGNNQPALSKARVAALTIPLPPLSEQQCILAEREQIDVVVDRLRVQVTTSRLRGASLRGAILAAAFTGQLVRQDSDHEPASVLLDRIRAEGAAAPKRRAWRAGVS